MLKHGILGLLNYGDMTGYEIREVFRDSLNFFWTAQTSQIYRELLGLEKKGWASSTLIEQNGKPDKKVYSITDAGQKELLRWLSEDEGTIVMRSPILMKVFFLGERSIPENIAYFQKFKAQCQAYLGYMTSIPGHIKDYGSQIPEPQKMLYWEMTADYGIRIMQMYIDWADACIKKLEKTEEKE